MKNHLEGCTSYKFPAILGLHRINVLMTRFPVGSSRDRLRIRLDLEVALSEQAKTIVVVDDDPQVRLLLRRCLETDNYTVLEAENGKALDAHLDRTEVDLITLDLNLGTENGLTIAAGLRARSEVPIIIVTGKGDVIDKVVGLEMGADDYISSKRSVKA